MTTYIGACVCVFWKYRKYGIAEIPNHLNMPAFSREFPKKFFPDQGVWERGH